MYKIYTKNPRVPEECIHKPAFSSKLFIAVLIMAFIMIGTTVKAQKVTLNVSSATLKSVLIDLHKQTQYDFLYTDVLLQHARPVTISVKATELKEVLNMLFKSQPLTYVVDEHTIVIKEKAIQKLAPVSADNSKPILIIGVVTGSSETPLNGASVTIKRTKTGTSTDRRGMYTLTTALPGDTLLVNYIGYKTEVVEVRGQNIINIKLQEATNKLDEVVIRAYGTTTQRLSTGDIARVTAADIEKQPIMNPILALEGRIPGLEVTPTSGEQSAPVFVELRGRNSINGNFTSDPLYVIDGVPQAQIDLNIFHRATNVNSASPGFDQAAMAPVGGQSPFFSLNPSDIASIEVLKDADATAIYGSRGANGVILITTKKGKPGTDALSVNVSQGIQYQDRHVDLLNTQQYLNMRRMAFANDNLAPTTGNAPDLLLADTNSYIDWQKIAYGGVGLYNSDELSYSGGNDQTTFRVGVGFNNSKAINTFSGFDRRISLSSGFTQASKNRRFNLAFSTNFSYAETNQVNLNVALAPPDYPALFDPNGNLNFAGYDKLGIGYPNPDIINPYDSKTNFLNTSLNLSYDIIKGLAASVNLGYGFNYTNQTTITYIASIDPASTQPRTGQAQYGSNTGLNWVIEPQLTYNRRISKGTLDVLLGATDQSSSTRAQNINSTGYNSDDLIHSLIYATAFTATDGYGQYKYDGAFARIGFNWDNKYSINLNGRRDGSSRFSPENRYGNFGSVGALWIASDEKWLKDALPKQVSFVKFRGSYGTTGGDGVGDYAFLSQIGNASTLLSAYNSIPSLTAQILENPNFHWQVNKKLEGALDLGFFDDRISVDIAYYRNRVGNQLVQFPIPEITGFTSIVENSPALVQNTGWEYSLNAEILTGAFKWSMSFNTSTNNNKLLAYPNLQLSPYYSTLKIGESLNDVYVFNYTGVDPKTGQYTFTDHNGDGIIQTVDGVPPGTNGDDRYIAISLKPRFMGGFSEQFSYKGISVSAFFSYRNQIGTTFWGYTAGSANNITLYQYQHTWTTPGQNAQFSKFTTAQVLSNQEFGGSNGVYTGASYLRMQTLSLGWGLPAKWVKHVGMSRLSLSANTQNIFTITSYKGLDPEVQNFPGLPPPRTIALGLNGSF